VKRLLWSGACVAALSGAMALGAPAQPAAPEARVDATFARSTATTPGCAVGVSRAGQVALTRAYGMADLEHGMKNGPDTIFEAGSVSKQFTAAAILLLARDGKLSLDDEARKYIPELPDYGAPLTIRHMLTHTSGLRDWGAVAAIAGWPRTTRVHTHAHVLDIVSRQRTLNFPSGTRWSYSNTGYNLAAVIVARVSGQSFAEFTRARIFAPLGMTRTSWRDDFTRVVRDRAVAYAPAGDGYAMDMPFEDVYGNGGLLTTVADLLRWTQNFSAPTVGDAAFVDAARTPGRFSDSRQHEYAMGLRINTYRGVKEIAHSGATAGYRAYLVEYPDQKVAVAVLCNAANSNPTQYAQAVADAYLGLPADEGAPKPAARPMPDGIYRSDLNGEPLTQAQLNNAARVDASGGGRIALADRFGTVEGFTAVPAAETAAKRTADYPGRYSSDEAEVVMTVAVEGDALVLKRRPDTVMRLTPVYADAFRAAVGFVRFTRDAAGRIDGFTISQERVWSMPFKRIEASK